MEIRTLKSFVKVAQYLSFTRAAKELNTVQPAISRQIAELEEELEVSLFLRTKRSVRITAAGEALLAEARDILAREEWARDQTKRAAKGEVGALKIGYLASACFEFMPRLICEYRHRYPAVQVTIRELTPHQQETSFDEERLDIGFSRPLSSRRRKNFEKLELYVDELMVALPASHPLAKRKVLKLQELERESWILFSREQASGLFDQVLAACNRARIQPRIVSQPVNMQTLLTEVASNLGVSVIPGCIRNLYADGVSFARIQGMKPSIPLEAQWRKDDISPTLEAFLDLINERRDAIRSRQRLGAC